LSTDRGVETWRFATELRARRPDLERTPSAELDPGPDLTLQTSPLQSCRMQRWIRQTGLVLTLTGLLAGCGQGQPAGPASEERVVGHWVLRSVDGGPVGQTTVRVEFRPDSKFYVVGPCHRSEGQYFLTPQGATLEPLGILEEWECPEPGRTLTRRVRASARESVRVRLDSDGLRFVDRAGKVRLLLERDDGQV
jgi:hypothetical protein